MCFVPILRAGLGMADGMAELVPGVSFGHIGLYRDSKTHQPVEYYCKLPGNIGEKEVYLIDPMLATGGSAVDAVKMLKAHGAKKITFICIIAAPQGVKTFCEENPDIKVCKCNVDEQMELAQEYNVMSIPFLVVFKNGKPVDYAIGVQSKENILKLIKK